MLATFFGVLLGSLVALTLARFWILGAMIGAVISASLSAYLFFDIKELLRVIPKAWDKAIAWRPSSAQKYRAKCFLWTYILASIGTSVAIITLAYLCWFAAPPQITDLKSPPNFIFSLPFLLLWVFTALLFTVIIEDRGRLVKPFKGFLKGMVWVNPITGPFLWVIAAIYFAVKYSFIVLASVISAIAWLYQVGLPKTWSFLKEVFIQIHCRDRMMCLLDASFGMIVAFLVQWQIIGGGQLLSLASILLGGITGTTLFFFNREIVAIRWLGVVPNGEHAH